MIQNSFGCLTGLLSLVLAISVFDHGSSVKSFWFTHFSHRTCSCWLFLIESSHHHFGFVSYLMKVCWTCGDATVVSCSSLFRSICMLFVVGVFVMLGRSTNRSYKKSSSLSIHLYRRNCHGRFDKTSGEKVWMFSSLTISLLLSALLCTFSSCEDLFFILGGPSLVFTGFNQL